jgi:FkbM family methyltransferase
MYLDEYDSLGFLTREYEPGTSEIVSRLTMPDAVAVDVGAHIGFYTLLLSQRVGGGGQVYAFEPETTNFQLLSRNVQLNHCTNVTLEDSAVSDAAGRASLYVNEHNRGDPRLAPLASGGRSVVVRTVALDNYFNGRRKPDIIKIDVQGAEWRVLAGMRNLLAAPAPIVVIEWTPELIRSSGGDPVALLEEFRSRGFALFEVREPSLDLVPIEDEWIAAARPPGFYANLLCLPSDRSNGMRLLT